ncbi:dipeptidase [candidate division KSB1 bacterium]
MNFSFKAARLFKTASVLTVFLLIFSLFYYPVNKAEFDNSPEYSVTCTSIIAGKLATVDGSTITSHTCDSFGDRTWANIVPRERHEPGSTVEIFRNMKYPEFATDLTRLIKTGEIPQVEETYAFFNTAYPAMNEYQVGMGETTIGGRRELRTSNGIFQIEELQRIVFQRTRTARDAVQMMGDLAEKYGYIDTGECLTVIDPEEAWHFEIFGPGRDKFGAVWAAVRIPDDHVGVSANIPRIAEVDINDTKNYMASSNIYSLAEEMGWWDPNSGEPFKMWKAYSGRKPFSIREFWILSHLAPSLNLSYDDEELPFTVKPEKKISAKDVMEYFKETYTGTQYDMLKNLTVTDRRSGEKVTSPVVHPWMNSDMRSFINELKPDAVERFRPIAVETCAYSTVIQARNWLPDAVGGVCWFSWHHAAMSARTPIFAGVKELPPDYSYGAQRRFRRDSAAWAFRRAERLAVEIWPEAKPVLDETIRKFEEQAFFEIPGIEKKYVELSRTDPEKALDFITDYSNNFCRSVTHKYWELGDQFWGSVARKW